MFDNPKKELQRLEEELLAAEATDDTFEEIYDELYDEFSDLETADDPPIRNHANGYGAPATSVYTDQIRYVPAEPKKNTARGWKILFCLECLGIVAVILWWLQYLL